MIPFTQYLMLFALLPAVATHAAETGLPALTDDHLPAVARTADEALRIARITAPTTDFTAPEPFEGKPAGAASVRLAANRDAFSQFSATLSFAQELDFKLGNAVFRKLWVSSPASTLASDGLGPLYNARACQACHIKDGRGHAPDPGAADAVSMVLRIAVPADTDGEPDTGMAAISDYLATVPDPVYGAQLQDLAIAGHAPEMRLSVSYSDIKVPLAGGEMVTLRHPTFKPDTLGYGPLAPGAMLSARVAPQMPGLGLLEAVPAADILAHADAGDADGDGISGRPNVVWSGEFGKPMLGRFGLKAGAPTLRTQTANAFSADMGLSTPLHPFGAGDCTTNQPDCSRAPDGAEPGIRDGLEVDAATLDLVTFYASNLGVPSRRDMADPTVLRGKALFYGAGCSACHTPKFVTARLQGRDEHSFQLIWPYTDLLLHDMGEGLADGTPEGRATGQEWRTPPLWGIGLTETVSGTASFLHDGRARSLLEAVLWHGGEAAAPRDAVIAMPSPDRAALIAFLGSL